jgi:hypothetical protein
VNAVCRRPMRMALSADAGSIDFIALSGGSGWNAGERVGKPLKAGPADLKSICGSQTNRGIPRSETGHASFGVPRGYQTTKCLIY